MKKIFLLALASICLTGCKITFSPDPHDEGFSDGDGREARVIEYFAGDQIVTEGHTKHEITFHDDNEGSQKDLTTFDDVKTAMTDADTFVTNVENIKSVGQFHYLKVGNASENIDGGLKFTFASNISAVEIIAQPRWSVVFSGLAETTTIDANVAINANGSKYVKINSNFTDSDSIEPTTAKFNIASGVNTLDINVVFQRIEILQINLYE